MKKRAAKNMLRSSEKWPSPTHRGERFSMYMVSFSLSRYHIWITSGLVVKVICWISALNEPMRWQTLTGRRLDMKFA